MATTIFINGSIWPGTPEASIENAIAIEGSKIIALGDEALKLNCDETVDLKGSFISPSICVELAHETNEKYIGDCCCCCS